MKLKILLASDFGKENKIQDYKLNLLVNLLKSIKDRSGLTDFDIYNFNLEDESFKGVVHLNSLTDYWDDITEYTNKFDILLIMNSEYSETRFKSILRLMRKFKYQYSYYLRDYDTEYKVKSLDKIKSRILRSVNESYLNELPSFLSVANNYILPERLTDTNIITCMMLKDSSYDFYRCIAESLHLFNSERFKWRMDYVDSRDSMSKDFMEFWDEYLSSNIRKAEFIKSGNTEDVTPSDYINKLATSRLIITNDFSTKILCDIMNLPVRYWNTQSVKSVESSNSKTYEDFFVDLLNNFKIYGKYELES